MRRCPVAVQNLIYMEDFVYKANRELNRLSRFAFTTEYKGSDRDQNERRVFIGDLVHVIDSNDDYNDWVVMVDGITPCGMLRCSLEMPPGRVGQTAEGDEESRMNRPRYRNCLVRISHGKVWGPIN